MFYQRLINYQRLKDGKSIPLDPCYVDSICCSSNNNNLWGPLCYSGDRIDDQFYFMVLKSPNYGVDPKFYSLFFFYIPLPTEQKGTSQNPVLGPQNTI